MIFNMCRDNFVSFFAKSLLLFFLLPGARSNEDEEITVFLKVVAGQKVLIPCNMTPAVEGDSNTLLLWYKDGSEVPFYSLDNRTDDGEDYEPQHFVTDQVQNRAYFNMASRIPRLEIRNVRESDKGIYRCRVDFLKSRTVNYQAHVDVIVPPETPVVRNEYVENLSGIIGPYNEDDSLFLVCEVKEGKPRPSLKWWRGPELIQGKYIETSGGIVRNDLIISRLTRKHYRMNLTCSASNNNLTQPPSVDIQIDMNFKPQSVNISRGRKPLTTKKTNELVCRSTGSIPPAKITWWKGSKKLKSIKYFVSEDKMTSTSILAFKPTPKDNGAYLSCRAENLAIDGSAMEDGMKIEVHFAPQVTLNVQSGIDGSIVEEGSDVFFSCSIHAHPAVEKIEWMYNGKPLIQNQTDNIIISNESLHLQKVQRRKNGDYSCMGRNKEGKGISNTVTLRVKYAPICKDGQIKAYGISMHEPAQVKCEVDADPQFVDFKWKFNNSKEEFGILAFKSKGLSSIATYTPRTNEDYGFLFCTATNSVGDQRTACVYTLIFAAPPEPVANCTVVNQTVEMVHVICDAGDDGGLQQVFYMEVYDREHYLQANISSKVSPNFLAANLSPDMQFLLIIYAKNSKGRSQAINLVANTAKFTQKQTSEAEKPLFVLNPIILILIGVVASLVIIAVIIVIVMRSAQANSRRHRKSNTDQIKTHIPFQTTIIDQDFQQYEMKDPDIIPARNSVNDSGYEDFGEDSTRKKKNNETPYDGVLSTAKLLTQNNSNVSTPKSNNQNEEVAYAELSLPPNGKICKDTIRRQETPTEYATIDFQRKSKPRTANNSITHPEDSDTSVDTPLMNNKLESTV